MPQESVGREIVFLGLNDWGVIALTALLCAGSLLLAYRAILPLDGFRKRAAIILLRFIALAFIVTAMAEPNIERSRVIYRKPELIIALDTSRSMSLPSGPQEESRLLRSQNYLKKNADALRAAGKDVHARFFRFNKHATETSLEALCDQTKAEGLITDMNELFKTLRREAREIPVTLLLFSDGCETPGGGDEIPPDARAAELLGGANIKVFAFCPGPASGIRDIAIEDVRAEAIAFTRREWSADVTLRVNGFAEGSLPVTLRSDNDILSTVEVPLQPGQSKYKVKLAFVPRSAGKELLRLETPVRSGELIAVNNSESLILNVMRDRIRVLLVAGRPGWDVRYLRDALKQDPSVDLISFFVLRNPDSVHDPEDETQLNLIPFPVVEIFGRELENFDVVIFHDFDYKLFDEGIYSFAGNLERLRQHVMDNGAGFIMIGCGQSLAQGGYAATPLADILPVRLDASAEKIDASSFEPEVTEAGKRHPLSAPITRSISTTPITLDNCLLTGIPDSGSIAVLLQRPARSSAPSPVIAVREAGSGRSMAVMTDSLWRWGFQEAASGGNNRLFVDFWWRSIRWLVRDPSLRAVKLTADRSSAMPGEDVGFTLRAMLPDASPAAASEVEFGLMDEETQFRKLGGVSCDPEGVAAFKLNMDEIGRKKVIAKSKSGSIIIGEDFEVVRTRGSESELKCIEPGDALLNRLAALSGGSLFKLPDWPAAGGFRAIQTATPIKQSGELSPLWSHWAFLFTAISAIVAEMWLRRRCGLW